MSEDVIRMRLQIDLEAARRELEENERKRVELKFRIEYLTELLDLAGAYKHLADTTVYRKVEKSTEAPTEKPVEPPVGNQTPAPAIDPINVRALEGVLLDAIAGIGGDFSKAEAIEAGRKLNSGLIGPVNKMPSAALYALERKGWIKRTGEATSERGVLWGRMPGFYDAMAKRSKKPAVVAAKPAVVAAIPPSAGEKPTPSKQKRRATKAVVDLRAGVGYVSGKEAAESLGVSQCAVSLAVNRGIGGVRSLKLREAYPDEEKLIEQGLPLDLTETIKPTAVVSRKPPAGPPVSAGGQEPLEDRPVTVLELGNLINRILADGRFRSISDLVFRHQALRILPGLEPWHVREIDSKLRALGLRLPKREVSEEDASKAWICSGCGNTVYESQHPKKCPKCQGFDSWEPWGESNRPKAVEAVQTEDVVAA